MLQIQNKFKELIDQNRHLINVWQFDEELMLNRNDDPDELVNEYNNKYGYSLSNLPSPVYQDNLDNWKSIIKEFNPKWIIDAGDDSIFDVIDYPESQLIYKHPSKRRAPNMEIHKSLINNSEVLIIYQSDYGYRLNLMIFKESDKELADVLGFNINMLNRIQKVDIHEYCEFVKSLIK